MFKSFGLLAAIAFVTHFVWESLHLPLYTGYGNLGGPLPVQLFATLGDVFYTLLAVALMSLVKGRWQWLIRPRIADYAALALAGLCIALFVEHKAQVLMRWAYAPEMPLIFGFGVSPLLQMTILLPLCVYLVSLFVRHRSAL